MKIGELTLNEIKETCDKTERCVKCRLWVGWNGGCLLNTIPTAWTSEDMEREVEDGERDSTV